MSKWGWLDELIYNCTFVIQTTNLLKYGNKDS